ncbi:MAG TPA: sigma 54-interacting transcriptional regulator [Acidobacteriota bacterium]|nr:sigma 54-interacting transcriptional regulator [Acidobacteriota bacterium]
MSQPLFVRDLTDTERATLTEWLACDDTEKVHRAKVILYSDARKTAYEIGELLSSHPDNLKKWIREFNRQGLEGIIVRKRGPQGKFSAEQINQILELYRQPPRRLGYNFDYWTPQKLANIVMERGIVPAISHVTMRQILREAEGEESDASGAEILPFVSKTEPASNKSAVTSSASTASELARESFAFVTSPEPLTDQPLTPGFPPPQIVDPSVQPEVSFEAAFQQSQALMRRGNYVVAAGVFRSLLEQRKDLSAETEAKIRCWLSEALEGLGRYEESLGVIECYEDPLWRSQLSESAYAWSRLRLGLAYARTGGNKAITRLKEALRIFEELEDFEGFSAAQYGLAFKYCENLEFKIAHDHLNLALKYERLITNRQLLAHIYLTSGVIKFKEGFYADAIADYQKVQELSKEFEDHRLRGVTRMNLGVSEYEVGNFKAAAEHYSAALEEFKRGAQVDFLVRTYCNLADGLTRLGRCDEADQYLAEAMEVAEQLKDQEEKLGVLVNRGELRLIQGRLGEAEVFLTQALELMTENNRWVESYTQRVLAQVYHLDGRVEQAFKLLRTALQRSSATADIQNIYYCHLYLVEMHYSQKSYDQAEEYLELAKGHIKESQDMIASGHAHRLEGQLAAARGRVAEAESFIDSSIAIFNRLEDKHKLALSHLAKGLVMAQKGDLTEARLLIQQAFDAFAEIGASLDLARAKDTLEKLDQGKVHLLVPQTEAQSQPVSTYSGVSDLLLIMRLMEAAPSRDLLLQELTSILLGHFDLQRAIVWEVREEKIKAVSGLKPNETPPPIERLLRTALSDRRSLPPGQLIHLIEDRPVVRTVLWIEARPGGRGFDLERLRPYLKQAEMGLEYAAMRSQTRLAQPIDTAHSRTHTKVPGFIYSSPLMVQLVDRIQRINRSDVPVLITGESGTGKELIARAVHAESKRRDNVFLPFNCTTSTRDMIDSQLFGYKRGAFTGAYSNHLGIIRAAENGTLFLDEIGDLALEVQPKLLRFLQENEIQPLGETMPVQVDVRVIAATNADLEQAVQEGRFREDLYFRLNVIHLHVPPLRERRDEIPILAAHYLDQCTTRERKKNITFSRDALHALSDYYWPGNIRQLKAEIQRVVAYTNDGEVIMPPDLSSEITTPRFHPTRSGTGSPRPTESETTSYHNLPRFSSTTPPSSGGGYASPPSPGLPQYYEVEAHPLAAAAAAGAGAFASSGSAPGSNNRTLREETDELERRRILEKLAQTGNNVSRTARELGLSRRGLKLKMEQLGIDTSRIAI